MERKEVSKLWERVSKGEGGRREGAYSNTVVDGLGKVAGFAQIAEEQDLKKLHVVIWRSSITEVDLELFHDAIGPLDP